MSAKQRAIGEKESYIDKKSTKSFTFRKILLNLREITKQNTFVCEKFVVP